MGTFNSATYVKPVVSSSSGTWGGLLNTVIDQVDTDFTAIDTRVTTVEGKTSNLSNAFTPVTAFTGLSDTPASLGSDANKYVRVNSNGDALEFATVSAGGIALTDLSVGSELTASGDGGITYTSGTGVFQYTPPDLSTYAPLASPVFTGNPVANTQSAGNSTTRLATTAFVQGELPKVYRTSAITLVAQQVDTYTHSLGGKPDGVQFILVCVTGEHGYSTNDEVMYLDTSSDASYSPSVFCENTTQIKVQHGYYGRFQISHKTTGLASLTTLANWKYKLKAWKFA